MQYSGQVKIRLIDTHCHLCHGRLQAQLDAVMDRARTAGVIAVICAAGDINESKAALGLARQRGEVYCIAGVHPHDAKDAPADYLERIRQLASDPRNVAIGEIGLDYHYNYSPPDAQRRVFAEQLELAHSLGKRIILHTREAFEDTLGIICESPADGSNVVFHSCTADPADVRRALDLGAMISFSGIVTFAKSDNLRESARLVPLERLLIETDGPFLSPIPVRKMRTNEPANLAHIAKYLSELYHIPLEQLAEQTTANAIRFFALDASGKTIGSGAD